MIGQGEVASSCIRGGFDWILGKILKEWSGIGTGSPGKWWSFHQKTCRHGTSGLHGLVGMVVLCWQWDWIILEVFTNRNDSIISFCADFNELNRRRQVRGD